MIQFKTVVCWFLVCLIVVGTTSCQTIGAELPHDKRQRHLAQLQEAQKKSDYEKMLGILKEMLAESPRSYPIHRLYQDVRARQLRRLFVTRPRDYEHEARAFESEYKALLEKNPKDPLYFLLLSRAAFKLGDANYTKRAIDAALEIDPNYAPALVIQGHFIFENEGDDEKAKQLYDKALALDPNLPSALVAVATLPSTDPNKAMELLKKAADLDPMDLGIRLKIALLLSMTGNDEKALTEINRVLELDPELEKAHFSKAAILRSQNDVDAAIKEAEKEVALHNSASTQASFLLGQLYMDKKDYEKAKEKFRWAIKWSPHAPFAAAARKALEEIEQLQQNDSSEKPK